MTATLRVGEIPAKAEPANAESAIQRSGAPAMEGAWSPDPRFTFLKMGSCVRIYRCMAPGQARARHFTASSFQSGMCISGVDSVDYCGLCETDPPKQRCAYDLK